MWVEGGMTGYFFLFLAAAPQQQQQHHKCVLECWSVVRVDGFIKEE